MRSVVGGFTLIEVLVAVCVLAVGIVGAAGTQLTALRTRQQSALLSDAVQLAGGLADRMRANAEQMRAPDAANPYLQASYDATADGAPSPSGPLCHANANCGSAELAQFDIYETRLALHAGFPGGRVVVCRDAQMWDAGRGVLAWACRGAAGAPVVVKVGWRARRHPGAPAQDDAIESAPGVAIVVPAEAE